MMRCVHGPVLPVWQHGSRLTYNVAPRALTGAFKREDLGVRFAGARMTPLANDHAVGHDDGADERIGCGHAFRARRVKQRAPHEVGVGHHFS